MKIIILFTALFMHAIYTNAQNVGIGTGSFTPNGRLEVRGTSSSASTNTLVLRNSLGDTLLRMRDDGRIGIGNNHATTFFGRTLNLGGTGIALYNGTDGSFGGAIFPTDTSLVVWSNSGANNYLVFQPSWGNTGIGTYTPNAKLHLNGAMLIGTNSARTATGYQLSVDGKIIAEEVRVLVSTSWPDYVFDDNYKLMPIDELEKSIRQNRHLPNIPAATVIEKEGLNLGDMNKRLMEKTEELTLYIIELNKKYRLLEEKIKMIERDDLKK